MHKSTRVCTHLLSAGVERFSKCALNCWENGWERVQSARERMLNESEDKRNENACAWNRKWTHNYTRFCSEIRASLESLNTSLAALGTMSKGQGMWRDRYNTCPFYYSPFSICLRQVHSAKEEHASCLIAQSISALFRFFFSTNDNDKMRKSYRRFVSTLYNGQWILLLA